MDHLGNYPATDIDLYTTDHLQNKGAEILFDDVKSRPSAYTMASLVEQGMTESDIVAAGSTKGYKAPVMDEVLQDLDGAIPFIQQVSDEIASNHGDKTIWLAARDFEAVADDFLVRFPELTAYLLPASQDLLLHESMGDPNLAARFLGKYGLTAAQIADPGKKFAIFDSGFRGTIGQEMDYLSRRIYGTSLDETGRLTNELVSINTAEPTPGEQIMDFAGGASNFNEERLPRTNRIIANSTMRPELFSETHGLAVMLQTLPRFHNAFGMLVEHYGDVVAVPRTYEIEHGIAYEPIDDNVDRPSPEHDFRPNDSIVNPVAAAVVMYRIVKSALDLKPDAMIGVDRRQKSLFKRSKSLLFKPANFKNQGTTLPDYFAHKSYDPEFRIKLDDKRLND
jgi:hypothetical protein